jgi:MoxR-like ATPase
MDRFLLRLRIGYPGLEDEIAVLKEQREAGNISHVQPVLSGEQILAMQREVDQVQIDESLLSYLAQIVAATRASRRIELGVSTRGALALRRAAQAKAYYEQRNFCVPDDIKSMVLPVLAHRIQVYQSYESGDELAHDQEEEALNEVLSEVEVPL